jgi:hypothetical protein
MYILNYIRLKNYKVRGMYNVYIYGQSFIQHAPVGELKTIEN